jgi:tRNA A37 methylthiotransferase MiaB
MAEPIIITLGCRLNAYESDVVRRNAIEAGLDDAVIVNTCAVTGEAVRQATQTIRRLRRAHPASRIIVTGCAAQIEPKRFAAMDEVDHVVGNAEKLKTDEPIFESTQIRPVTTRAQSPHPMFAVGKAFRVRRKFKIRYREVISLIEAGVAHQK